MDHTPNAASGVDKLQAELARLHGDMQKLVGRRKVLLAKIAKAQRQINDAERALKRERLRQHVGGQVKRKYRSHQQPRLNDAVGVLIEVRRTRCTIEYSEPLHGHKQWSMPIDDVAFVDEDQGHVVSCGAALLA